MCSLQVYSNVRGVTPTSNVADALAPAPGRGQRARAWGRRLGQLISDDLL